MPAPCDCSVVLIALAGGSALESCLRRLEAWSERCHVMLGPDMGDAAAWRLRFPEVRFSDGECLTVPMRRRRGMETAPGSIVALLEDTSLPEPGWLEAACDAFEDDNVAAAAGPVRIDPALDGRGQALACAEYGRFHPGRFPRLALGAPDASGTQAVSRLPGNNLAYRRARVLEMLQSADRGVVESEVNEMLRSRGFTLAYQPRMAVTYAAADPRGARLGVRVRHGRFYAGLRVAGKSYPARLGWFAKSLLLPAVLSVRALCAMVTAVEPAAWPRTAPWICLMESAWAAGESIGYLAGAGRSVEVWR